MGVSVFRFVSLVVGRVSGRVVSEPTAIVSRVVDFCVDRVGFVVVVERRDDQVADVDVGGIALERRARTSSAVEMSRDVCWS